MIISKRLCIFYGYPSLVNQSATINDAVNTFAVYDLVIFGAGLEQNNHPNHNASTQIIGSLLNTQVFGYIDSRQSMGTLKNKIGKWKNMGVSGIFCDQFGYDNGLTRTKQNEIVDEIHNQGLIAFVDPWDPNDAFSPNFNPIHNPNELPSHLNINDWYLAQSYRIINGTYDDTLEWKTKSDKMVMYKNIFGTKMACISTYDNSPYDQLKADFSYASCAIYGFDAWGFGEYNYSATNSLLPFRPRKELYGTEFTSAINNQDPIYSRQTNIGIKIDTTNHTVDIVLE